MDESLFWQILDGSVVESNGDSDHQIDHLAERLREMTPETVVAFQHAFDLRLQAAYFWDLWGAAHLLNRGKSSSDEFETFRAWLIGQGQDVYESALANPDSLIEVTDAEVDEYEFEELLHLPRQIFEEITGQETAFETIPQSCGEPLGTNWDFESETENSRRLPNLWQRAEAFRKTQARTVA